MLLATVIAIAAIIMISASFVVLRRERNEGLTIDPPDLSDVVDIGDVLPGVAVADTDAIVEREPVVDDAPRASFRERLAGARSSLSGFFGGIFAGGIDRDTWEALEEALIRADVGVVTSTEIMEAVKARVEAERVEDAAELPALVKAELVERLSGFDRSLSTDVAAAGGQPGPAVWLFVGVNGVGKTTTIGKLAKREVDAGRKIVLAAGTRSVRPPPNSSPCGPNAAMCRSSVVLRAPIRRRSCSMLSSRPTPAAPTSCWPTPLAVCRPRPT